MTTFSAGARIYLHGHQDFEGSTGPFSFSGGLLRLCGAPPAGSIDCVGLWAPFDLASDCQADYGGEVDCQPESSSGRSLPQFGDVSKYFLRDGCSVSVIVDGLCAEHWTGIGWERTTVPRGTILYVRGFSEMYVANTGSKQHDDASDGNGGSAAILIVGGLLSVAIVAWLATSDG